MPDKKTINDAVVRWALTIVLGVSAYLFWSIGYPHAMGYQEQFQLFLFDYSYFAERIAVPGGLGTYVAEFLTQFYNGHRSISHCRCICADTKDDMADSKA